MNAIGKYVGNGELAGTIRALLVIGSIIGAVFYALERVEEIVAREITPVKLMIERHDKDIDKLWSYHRAPSSWGQ